MSSRSLEDGSAVEIVDPPSDRRRHRWEKAVERVEAEQLVKRLLDSRDAELEYELRHPDFVADMPQSGERFATRESLREMQRGFPGGAPKITLRRLVGDGDVWVAEATNDYGAETFFSVLIIELRDGLIWRETRYYTSELEAPAWRASLVEPMPTSVDNP